METRSRFGSGFAHFRHGFNETGLFGDECLAELIDRYPREHYVMTTMTETRGERVWRNGGFGGLGGNAVLEGSYGTGGCGCASGVSRSTRRKSDIWSMTPLPCSKRPTRTS